LKTHSCIVSIGWVVVALLTSCAQVVAPTGGKKDEIPPALIKAYPKDKTTHFNAPQIVLQFDEYIQINNTSEQVVISPSLDVKPEYILQGKKLMLDFKKQPLKVNTTYTINFGNSVGDLHENNLIQNLTYVFSTGAIIDTFNIKGTCRNAFNNLPEKEMMIGLYPKSRLNDSVIYKEKPAYFGRSDANGNFRIPHIPLDSFRVVAFKDENKNLLYNHPEMIGFVNGLCYSGSTDSAHYSIFTFIPDLYDRGKLMDTLCRFTGKFQFAIYKADPDQARSTIKSDYTWFSAGKQGVDTLTVFRITTDTLPVFKVRIKKEILEIPVRQKKGLKLPLFQAEINRAIELNDTIKIGFTTPVVHLDTSRIKIKEDTILMKQPEFHLSPYGRGFWFIVPQKENTRYQFELLDSACKDLFGQFQKGIKHSWNSKSLKDYGLLKLTLINPFKTPIILQMTNEQETQVFKEFRVDPYMDITLEYLQPTTYKLKFIVDRNKNNQWDNGNFKQESQPEQVYYFPENIVLRANWDIEQKVDLSAFISPETP
jgi:hypothetical protein